MLVVDVYTLLFVYSLYLLEKILIYTFDAVKSQYVVRVERTSRYLPTGEYLISLFDIESGSVRDDISSVFFLTADSDFSLIVLTSFDGDDFSVGFADLSDTLRLSRLEKLLYSRKTLGDVAAGYSSRMEGSHVQLSTRFSDGLIRSYTYSLSYIDFLTCRQVSAVASCADTGSGVTGHY